MIGGKPRSPKLISMELHLRPEAIEWWWVARRAQFYCGAGGVHSRCQGCARCAGAAGSS
jgi:hypothetical protein